MPVYHAELLVYLRPDLLDPQGRAVKHALNTLGFHEVEDVRMGKAIRIRLQAENDSQARDRLKEMAEKLLTNPVIEDYRILSLEQEP